MFCAKTHNMGFVSLSDNKTPIVPLQGAALRAKGFALNLVLCGQQKRGLARPSLLPVAAKNNHYECFFATV